MAASCSAGMVCRNMEKLTSELVAADHVEQRFRTLAPQQQVVGHPLFGGFGVERQPFGAVVDLQERHQGLAPAGVLQPQTVGGAGRNAGVIEHVHQQLQVVVVGHQQCGVLGAGVRLHQANQLPGQALRGTGALPGLGQNFPDRGGLGLLPEHLPGLGRLAGPGRGILVGRNELGLEVKRLGAPHLALGPLCPPAAGTLDNGKTVAGGRGLLGNDQKAGWVLGDIEAGLHRFALALEIDPGLDHPDRPLFAGQPGNAQFDVTPDGQGDAGADQQQYGDVERQAGARGQESPPLRLIRFLGSSVANSLPTSTSMTSRRMLRPISTS